MLGGALPALAIGAGAAVASSRSYTLQIDGLDVIRESGAAAGTAYGVDPDSIVLTERLGEIPRLTFTIDDPSKELVIRQRANVYMADHRGRRLVTPGSGWVSDDIFRGTILLRQKRLLGQGWSWSVTALGLDQLLDRKRPTQATIPAGITRKAALQQLLSGLDPRVSALARDAGAQQSNRDPAYLAAPFEANLIRDDYNDDETTAAALIAVAIPCAGKTYRQVCQAIIDEAVLVDFYRETSGALWAPEWLVYIDAQGRFGWRRARTKLPMRTIREGSSIAAGIPGPFDLEPADDSGRVVHRVYVQAATAAVSGWVTSVLANTEGDETYDEWLDAPEVTSITGRDAVGHAYLASRTFTQRQGFTYQAAHDDLFDAAIAPDNDDDMGGWHVGGIAEQVISDSGLFDTASSRTLWQLTRTWPGPGEIRLALVMGAASRDPAAALTARLALARDESRAAPRIRGTTRLARHHVQAAVPADTDYDLAQDGLVAVRDAGTGTLYVRVAGVWRSVALT